MHRLSQGASEIDQITGKLEAVGDTVEPFHFILHPKDEQYLTREDQDKGKELYSLLVQFEILQGDTIRKIFRNNSQERDKIEKIIRNDLDPSIADPLISLLNKLWQILNINKIEKELPRIYENKGKYAKIKFNDNGHETKDLKIFLIELKDNISQQNQYFYQTDLPFTIKEEEGNNIRIYLKEKNILKSGGLAKYKYVDIKRNIERILKNIQCENDKELILSKILSLQGDIRSFKTGLKANLKDFIDLQDQENVPSELRFFEGFNLNKFLIIEEDKSWWDWNAFAVAMIGLVQVIAEAVLIAFEENLLKEIIGLINNKVETVYLQKKTLGKYILLPQQFDNIRTRVVSSLRNSYHLFADGLKKSNSKYVKIAATTLKAIDIINKLWTVAQSVLQFEHVFIIL
ncbi:unnamed protein product [Rotaria sp. Silwood1]|nr:unnamed protein product [Rotaria sp. Silwood1]CAF1658134.1 unnamed protein product [Rotaria sp. Silwood1]